MDLPRVVASVEDDEEGNTWVYLDSDVPIVAATSMVGWRQRPRTDDRPAQSGLPHCIAVRCFASRVPIGAAPEDRAAAADRSIFTLKLSPGFWSRLFSELQRAEVHVSLEDLETHDLNDLDHVVFCAHVDTNAIALRAGDFLPAERFDIPAVAAVAARGSRSARPAIAAVQGPDELRFLHMSSLTQLVDFNEYAASPFRAVAILAGVMGNCLTAASRIELATSQPVAAALRAHITSSLGISSPVGDAMLSSHLKSVLLSLHLPDVLRCTEASFANLLDDFIVSINYGRSDGTALLAARLPLMRLRCAPYHSLLSL